jgi:hypothetical protein
MKERVVREDGLLGSENFSGKSFICGALINTSRTRSSLYPDHLDHTDQQAGKAAFLRHLLVRVELRAL